MKRIVTGILLAVAVICLVLWGIPIIMAVVQIAIALAGVWEFYRLAEAARFKIIRDVGYSFAVLLSIPTLFSATRIEQWNHPTTLYLAFCMLLLASVMAKALRHNLKPSEYLGAVAVTFLGPVYVAVPIAMAVSVWLQEDGPFYVLFTLVVIWVGDTSGYFIGKYFGRHKSSPRISPNKTWEGTIASFVAALLVGLITARYFWGGAEGIDGYAEPIALAAALNIAGQFGDLAESALKRSAGVKDSSNLVPGHGGVLDRIDALLFAAPVLWYYWLWHTA
jgi:phosphatidate cytidylyltransferase